MLMLSLPQAKHNIYVSRLCWKVVAWLFWILNIASSSAALPISTKIIIVVLATISLVAILLKLSPPNKTQCTSQGIFNLGT